MSTPENTSVRALIHGRVQGVGFRYFARERAASYGLVGYVRNLPDGKVEVRATGPRDSLRELHRLHDSALNR